MIRELIKIANKLDQSGLEKEADQLDKIIEKIAQQGPVEDIELEKSLQSLRQHLIGLVDSKLMELRAVGHSKPKEFGGSKSEYMRAHLQRSPVIIKYP